MKTTSEALLQEWATSKRSDVGVNRRLFPNLVLETRVGRDAVGKPMLAIPTPKQLNGFPKLTGIQISSTKSPQEVNWLVISLESEDAINEFAVFCEDLVDQVRSASDEEEGLRRLLQCLNRWKNLFLPRKSDLLSDEALRALTAELVALTQIAKSVTKSFPEAAKSWVGPNKAPQDFQIESMNLAVEVKAKHRERSIVTISSIEQLDTSDYVLELVLVQVEDIFVNSEHGFRLVDLIHHILCVLQQDEGALISFQEKLVSIGFELARPEYQNRRYEADRFLRFRVDDKFPRLSRAKIPPEILAAKYSLDSSKINEFLISDSTLTTIHIFTGDADES